MDSDGILLPVTPNRPLTDINQKELFGNVLLRSHLKSQLTENILYDSSLVVYDKNYQNNQSLSPAFFNHMSEVCEIVKKYTLEKEAIIEVGCGKGDFIKLLEDNNRVNIIGFDATYEGENNNIHNYYLNSKNTINADFIVSRQMMDYIHLPHEYLRMLKNINQNRHAKIYIEIACFDWIKENNAFFDITYERINYMTLKTLKAFFDGNVLESGKLFNDQYIYVVAELSKLSENFSLEYENQDNWKIETFENIFPQLLSSITNCKKMLDDVSHNDNKKRAFIWGAATKGCLFLYHYKRVTGSIENFPFLIDINPEKIGKFAPGTKVPICSPSEFFSIATENDVVIIPNANYEQEIRQQLIQAGLKDILLLSF